MIGHDYSLEALHLFDTVTLQVFGSVCFLLGASKLFVARLDKQREAKGDLSALVSSFSLAPRTFQLSD